MSLAPLLAAAPIVQAHAYAAFAAIAVGAAQWAAPKGTPGHHAQAMAWIYALALVVTGLFTLWPGRIMHKVVFGG